VRLDCSKSDNILFSTGSSIIDKIIEPGETEFYMHSIAIPSENKFIRVAECSIL